MQVLRLCQQAGLVKLGHVAVDSTKIKANARKDESLRYAAWTPLNKSCKRKYRRLLTEAQRLDDEVDGIYGAGRHGDELPAQLRRSETRLARFAN